MASTTEVKPITKKLPESDKVGREDSEVDVPDDFFDDFSNNDFMAGLDVVDAWEDGPNTGQNLDRDDGKVEAIHREEVTLNPVVKEPSKDNSGDKNDDNKKVCDTNPVEKSEITCSKDVDILKENNPKLFNKTEGNKSVEHVTKLEKEENMPKNTYKSESNALVKITCKDPETSSTDSDSNNKIDPILDLKDLKLNSQCKVILARDNLKSYTIDKLMVNKESKQGNPKEDTKSKESSSKEATEDRKPDKISSRDSKTLKLNSKTSKSSKSSKSSRDNPRDQLKSRDILDDDRNQTSESLVSRRDPEKTKRDIQRNKEKMAKEKEAKFVDEKLRLVETGLVPPGTEMDVDLDKHEGGDGSKKVVGDLRNKIKGGERDRRERDRDHRSKSRDRKHDESSTKKRRHSDKTKSSHTKRPKDTNLSNASNDNISLSASPSPNHQPHIHKPTLLERRGRYTEPTADTSPERERRIPLQQQQQQRDHSNSSSRRTLTIAEDMVRSLQTDAGSVGPQQQHPAPMGKGDRIPRRIIGRSRSRSRSYEKYRAYKRSPSPPSTLRGYGAGGGGPKEVLGPRVRLTGGREGTRRSSRERSPLMRDRQRERDRRSPRDIDQLRQRDRSRSQSPNHPLLERRKKAPTFLEELNEKLSQQQSHNPSRERRTFLEEIREKINRQAGSFINPQQYAGLPPIPPVPAPAPVPPPHQFHQQIPPTPIVYDQSFFIGDAPSAVLAPPMIINLPPQPMFGLMPPQHMQPPMMQPQPQPLPMVAQMPQVRPIANVAPPVVKQVPLQVLNTQIPQEQKLDKDSIAKLFSDKQITLTDFLSITSKVAGIDRPVDIAKKIKVISRCQDTVKVMSKDSRTTGRFLMCKSLAQRSIETTDQPTTSNKFSSPLKHNPAVRFRFTSKVPLNDDMVYRTSVQLLLHKLGLPDGTEPIRDPTPDFSEELQTAPEVFHRPLIIQEANNLKSVVPTAPMVIAPPPKKEVLQKMCQTDPVNLCRECKVRSQKKFASVGCQYDEKMLVNVGTQVNGTEDAFTPARANLQGLLKSRSLASLTPAQILAQAAANKTTLSKEVPNEEFISPDSKRGRIEPNQWQHQLDERDRGGAMMSTTWRDGYNYNEQQQERFLQQQLQMTMDSQQQKNNRLQVMNNRDMNPYQDKFQAGGNNHFSSGGNNSSGVFGGPSHNSGMSGGPGFNQGMSGPSGSNQFGGNQNYGGNRYYN